MKLAPLFLAALTFSRPCDASRPPGGSCPPGQVARKYCPSPVAPDMACSWDCEDEDTSAVATR